MQLAEISFFRVEDYLRRMQGLAKSLDSVNIKILEATATLGPRNLLEIARKTRLPASTVYSRVEKLNRYFSPLVTANIHGSKLGLVRHIILLQTKLGLERFAIDALKIPNYWRTVAMAEGSFNIHSVQLLPREHVRKFKDYLAELKKLGIAEKIVTTTTSDYCFNWPEFSGFNPRKRTWSFDWAQWLSRVRRAKAADELCDPESYDCLVDRKDLLIIKELQKDGRKRLSELGKTIGHTLQAVKFRFDKHILARGLVAGFELSMLPFPHEFSDLHEFRLDFSLRSAMNRFYAGASGLPFIRSFSKVLRSNSLVMRTYIPRTESDNLFAFFSELVSRSMLQAYSAVRISMPTLQTQTLSYELFEDGKGWIYNEARNLVKLKSMMVKVQAI